MSTEDQAEEISRRRPVIAKSPPAPDRNVLTLTNSWLFKGLKDMRGDWKLDTIVASDEPVVSRKKIEVLGEYTWITSTPSQDARNLRFPAIYVPGTSLLHSRGPSDDRFNSNY